MPQNPLPTDIRAGPQTNTGADPLMPAAFNEWMRRYIEEPGRFRREWQTVNEYLQQTSESKTPSYGERCTAYLCGIIEELRVAATEG